MNWTLLNNGNGDIIMKFKIFKKLLVMCFATFFTVGSAFAVHDEGFELEGNIVNNSNLPVDWADLFDVTNPNEPTAKAPLPAGFGAATFIRDFIPGKKGPDASTFTQGGKDTLNILGGWVCTSSNNLGAKFNIINAYAAAYIDPVTHDVIVYFGMERSGNEGDGNVGFWFLKDGTVGCEVSGHSGDFTGNHVDGDLMIVSEFSKGGKVADIKVYEWVGGAGGALNTTPVVSGGECTTAGPGDTVCAMVNDTKLNGMGPGSDIPWLTETKQSGNTPSNDLDVSKFFEGGLNLSANGLDGCFSTFMATTRSSTSIGSTVHDYAIDSFPLCSIAVTKTCSASALTAGNKFTIDYSIMLENTGAGSIPADEDITIDDTPSDGTAFQLMDTVANYDDEVVPDGWLPGEVITVTGSYESTVNGGSNTVDAQVSLGAGSVVADQYSIGCDSLQLTPMLTIEKNCTLSLDDSTSVVAVRKDYDVTVCNTGDAPLDVLLTDNIDTSLNASFALDFPLSCLVNADCGSGNTCNGDLICETSTGVLIGNFGGSVCALRTGSYLPSTLPTGTEGMLTNTATAVATSSVVDTGLLGTVGQSDSATCDLCPLTVEEEEP